MNIRLSVSDILFEDSNYIAVHKKSGWPVHQTLDASRSNLFSALKSYLKQRDKLLEDPYLSLHHRLDVQTSGIVVFGKTKEANPILSKIFSDRKAEKIYEAICIGCPLEKEGMMEDFLKKEKIKKIEKMVPVKSGGDKTITYFKIIDSNSDFSLVEFSLETGRMHQIRVQSALRSFPILGDDLYGDRDINNKMRVSGQLLHAKSFHFFDPLSGKDIFISCPSQFDLKKIGTINKNESTYIIFNKPFDVLCQFTKQSNDEMALCDFNLPKDIYAAGRLDKDSEGLLLLTNDGTLINTISSPKFKKEKTYWVQVERIPSRDDLSKLEKGVVIKGGYKTLPCKVRLLGDIHLWERNPPIRERKNVPTCWLEIIICEGKNRQVRSMTAAIGFPTLRLIRVGIGKINLDGLRPGEFKIIGKNDLVF